MKIRKIVLIAVLLFTIVPAGAPAAPIQTRPILPSRPDLEPPRQTFARILEMLRIAAVAVEKDNPALAKRIMKGYETAVRLNMLGRFEKASEHLRNEILILAESEIGQVRQGIRRMIAILTDPPAKRKDKTPGQKLKDATTTLRDLIKTEKTVIDKADRLRTEGIARRKTGKPLSKAEAEKRDRDLRTLEEKQREIGRKIDNLAGKFPNADKLKSARNHATKAADKFGKAGAGGRGKPGESDKAIAGGGREAGQARDDLKGALKDMEDRLRNLEQQKAVLNTKEALVRILKEQEAINVATRRESLVRKRSRADRHRVATLGRSQGGLARRIGRLAANARLRETGVVLPWMLEQVSADMLRVRRMIFHQGAIRIGKPTLEIQDGIVRDLKALIKALEDKKKELERKEERIKRKPQKKNPRKPNPKPEPKKKKSMPQIPLSELRILKYMEERLRDRTTRFRRTHPRPEKYTRVDAETIRGMSLRQKRIRTLSLQLIEQVKKAVEESSEETEPDVEESRRAEHWKK